MFTGLVERVGRLSALRPRGNGASLTIACDPWDSPLVPGESVAVQGICLTVTACAGNTFTCDVLAETLARGNLGGKPPGAALNLERALRVGDRLGGHIVQGHVDGTARVLSLRPVGEDRILRLGADRDLLAGLVPKGSVACDGVSLTLVRLDADAFEVALIPETWRRTSLRERRAGDTVNIETDVLGKYVRRLLGASAPPGGGVTAELLDGTGFV